MKHKYLKNVATLELNSDKCTGCGFCTTVCPHNVLEMQAKKVAVIDKNSCMECGACAKNCPFGALSVDAGVGCAFAIINGILKGGAPSCDCGGNDDKGKGCC